MVMMSNRFNKIVLLGNGGSGKTYLANQLGQLLSIPILHLDKIYWIGKYWIKNTLSHFDHAIEMFIQQDRWIIEGAPLHNLEYRLVAADTIIFLDVSRMKCIYRAIKRSLLPTLFDRRIDDGNPIRGFSCKAIAWIWQFPSKKQPFILDLIYKKFSSHLFYLKNKNDLRQLFLLAKEELKDTRCKSLST